MADTNGVGAGWHQFCNLIGNDDARGPKGDSLALNVTFHHVWWADSIAERMPRVRFGKVHVYNDLFTSAQAHYCVRVCYQSSLLVEGNAFVGTHNPVQYYSDDSVKYPAGVSTVRKNLFVNTDGDTSGDGHGFTPPYAYALEDAATVETEVSDPNSGAGSTIPCWDAACAATGVEEHAAPDALSAVRIELVGGMAYVRNPLEAGVSVRFADLSGRILSGRLDIPAGGRLEIPSTSLLRVAMIRRQDGTESSLLLPPIR
jgi:hypothetical protein